ncbi:MAG: hypothetical protein E5V58_20810 [Mesorhizobium sp.]|nr:MAG: hypothetical protein EOS32_06280 [Mesorhizobium sp.]TIW70977.1 MAG: hypothetical protein E5V58_20810 [Mesorhizobium sp.]
MTVADMNTLEQAARVSMSGFQDAEAPASASSSVSHPLLRLAAAVILLAALALTLAMQFS